MHTSALMKRGQKTYHLLHKTAAVFLMATLAWLTLSTPYFMGVQQKQSANQNNISWNCNDCEDDCGDSSSNNVDEKAPNSNLSEEFLHEQHTHPAYAVIVDYNHGHEKCGIYIAYHGELHAPPPNAA